MPADSLSCDARQKTDLEENILALLELIGFEEGASEVEQQFGVVLLLKLADAILILKKSNINHALDSAFWGINA